MTFDWRPSRLDPGRIHLPSSDGRGRCGAPIGAPFTRCAVCVLLAEGIGAPAWIPVRVGYGHDDEFPARLSALGSPGLDIGPSRAAPPMPSSRWAICSSTSTAS